MDSDSGLWGGLGGRERAEGGPVRGEQEQAGTQAHHGGSSAVSVK